MPRSEFEKIFGIGSEFENAFDKISVDMGDVFKKFPNMDEAVREMKKLNESLPKAREFIVADKESLEEKLNKQFGKFNSVTLLNIRNKIIQMGSTY